MKKLNWVKQGRIFDPRTVEDWGYSHSQVPWAVEVAGKLKVYFTSRPPADEDGKFVSYTFFADIHQNNLSVLNLNRKPVLTLGELGHFDEFGVMPCSVINRDDLNEVWLYYVGWSRKDSVPYDCAIGLAISRDGGNNFSRYSSGPIVGQSSRNPFLLGCPRVFKFNDKWYMWYLAGTQWLKEGVKAESIYHLKLALSSNGIDWEYASDSVIPKKYENECQTCATVFQHDGGFHMYFTYRFGIDFRNPARGYRIGYAYSHDLISWERDDDKAGMNLSPEGWDSEMICYPSVSKIDGKFVMLYCGNHFGKEGFGYAILEM